MLVPVLMLFLKSSCSRAPVALHVPDGVKSFLILRLAFRRQERSIRSGSHISEDELIMIHSRVFEHDRLCAFFLFFFLYSYIVIVLCVLKRE